MRILFIAIILSVFFNTKAQTADEVVHQFFKALSAKDTEILDRLTLDDMQLHSLLLGNGIQLSKTKKTKFINSIKSIPPNVKIEERIYDITSLKTDHLAQFQVPYLFYVDDKLSHKGTNVLTLLKTKDGWRISYIADTRNK